MNDDEFVSDLTPEEADSFWEWLNRSSEMATMNAMLASCPDDEPEPGRNEPCPCGSGRKYKKCCLGKDGVMSHPWITKEENEESKGAVKSLLPMLLALGGLGMSDEQRFKMK